MEQPQEPAWLRNYKTRAAPFSAVSAKTPVQTLPPPPPAEHEIPQQHDGQPDSSLPGQHNTISIHFPSTMSLGLKSFGQPANPNPESSIHPALRGDYNRDVGHEGASVSSSRTKVEMGYKAHHFKKVEDKHETGWRTMMKGCIRRLGCHQ